MPPANRHEKKQYTISELASIFEISTHTIRFYEEKGLIIPERTSGNQRIYKPKDRVRLKLIIRGKKFGFSLDEIAEMIGMADTEFNEINQIDKSLAYAEEKLAEIRQRREELNLLEKDLLSLRDKFLKRQKELKP